MSASHFVAYLDPGSGSMILQLLTGGVAAVGVGAKFYWKRLRSFFHLGRNGEASGDDTGGA